jgi:two-component sensor histidine kinase
MTETLALSLDTNDRVAVLEKEVAELRRRLTKARAEAAAAEPERLVAHELKHRAKNFLSIIQSLSNQTLRGDVELSVAREALDRRLTAMGRAIDVLLKTDWATTELSAVVDGALAHREGFAARFRASGPPITIGANAAITFSMALHELEANAIKYGALAQEGGRVDLNWSEKDGRVRLEWCESGCKGVREPTRCGFGTRLICDIPAKRFGATARLDWADTGVTWTFDAPLARLQS